MLTLRRVYHLATVMFSATFKSTNEMKNYDFIHKSGVDFGRTLQIAVVNL